MWLIHLIKRDKYSSLLQVIGVLFLSNELDFNPDYICIDRAHRIGRRPISGTSRRPIIVAFRDYQGTVRIMERASRLKDTRYGIDRDYPAEISKARKLLWNRCKELKAATNNPSNVVLENPARVVVGKTVVYDAFLDWFKILKCARLEPSISEDAKSANKRAEMRQRGHQLQSSQRANAAPTSSSADGDKGVPERGTTNDTEVTDAAFYSGTSERYTTGKPSQQAPHKNRKQTVHSESGGLNGQSTVARETGNISGEMSGNGTRPPAANNMSEADRSANRDSAAKK